MNSLPALIVGLMRMRTGPQDFPASWPLCIALILLYLLVNRFTGEQLGDQNAAITTLAVSSLQYSAVAVMLWIRKYPQRLVQTVTALAGSGIVFALLAFGILAQADPERQQPILASMLLGLFVWSLAVDAHIFRHALSIRMPQGVLVAVLLWAASYVLVELGLQGLN